MEKFLNLPDEKQKTIIDAALTAFGTNGYKKASVNDIATAARISKSMVFHYFKSKKGLYIYLIDLAVNLLLEEMKIKFDMAVTDFFERIRLATKIKVSVMKRHPAILAFLNSVYFETDTEVADEIKNVFVKTESFRSHLTFDGIDAAKFKEGIDPQLVMKILILYTEGYISKTPVKTTSDVNVLLKEFDNCLNLMKNNFYKEEYL